jgi:hypothetical protein
VTRLTGTFTTLHRELAPMDWSEIVELVSTYARAQGLRWDDAARELAADAATTTGGTAAHD